MTNLSTDSPPSRFNSRQTQRDNCLLFKRKPFPLFHIRMGHRPWLSHLVSLCCLSTFTPHDSGAQFRGLALASITIPPNLGNRMIHRGLTQDGRCHGECEPVPDYRDGKPISDQGATAVHTACHLGVRKLSRDVKRRWLIAIPISRHIVENGLAGDHDSGLSLSEIIDHGHREESFRSGREATKLARVEVKIDLAS